MAKDKKESKKTNVKQELAKGDTSGFKAPAPKAASGTPKQRGSGQVVVDCV